MLRKNDANRPQLVSKTFKKRKLQPLFRAPPAGNDFFVGVSANYDMHSLMKKAKHPCDRSSNRKLGYPRYRRDLLIDLLLELIDYDPARDDPVELICESRGDLL